MRSTDVQALAQGAAWLCGRMADRYGGAWQSHVYPHDVLPFWCVALRHGPDERTVLVCPHQDTAKPPVLEMVTLGWSVTSPVTLRGFVRAVMVMGRERTRLREWPTPGGIVPTRNTHPRDVEGR